MLVCFTEIGSIASTTQKLVDNLRVQAIGHFIFELEKTGHAFWIFKNNSSFTKEKVSTDTIFKRVLKSSNNLPKNGKKKSKSFFSAVNVTGFSVNLLLGKFLMKLSINLIGNAFFFNISFKWHTSGWNLEKSEAIENVRNNWKRSK